MSGPDFNREFDTLKSTLVHLCFVQDDSNHIEDKCALIKSYHIKCNDPNPPELPRPYPPPNPPPLPEPLPTEPDGVGNFVKAQFIQYLKIMFVLLEFQQFGFPIVLTPYLVL